MAKVRRKAVLVRKSAGEPSQTGQKAPNGKKIIWRFVQVKLPFKPSSALRNQADVVKSQDAVTI